MSKIVIQNLNRVELINLSSEELANANGGQTYSKEECLFAMVQISKPILGFLSGQFFSGRSGASA